MATNDVATVDVLVVGGTFREVIESHDSEAEVRLGGSALTASIAAARMGASVAVSTFVGAEDEAAALTLLEHAEVRQELVVLPGASGTFVYLAESDDTKPRPLYRPAETSPVDLPPLPASKTLLLFGMPDFDPTGDVAVRNAARATGRLLWDRQGWLSRTRDSSAVGALDTRQRLLIANVDEAMDEGIIDPASGTITVPSGYEAAILKDGRRGALLACADGGRTAIAAYPVDITSNVGSGDVFAGVVAAELSAGERFERAVSLAAAATSAVLSTGATVAPPDLRELAEAVTRGASNVDWRWN